MSKSIYKETLTELETWKSTYALDREQLEKIDEHIEVMKKAVKQEKLLELYKRLWGSAVETRLNRGEYNDIKNQIKELEKQ